MGELPGVEDVVYVTGTSLRVQFVGAVTVQWPAVVGHNEYEATGVIISVDMNTDRTVIDLRHGDRESTKFHLANITVQSAAERLVHALLRVLYRTRQEDDHV